MTTAARVSKGRLRGLLLDVEVDIAQAVHDQRYAATPEARKAYGRAAQTTCAIAADLRKILSERSTTR